MVIGEQKRSKFPRESHYSLSEYKQTVVKHVPEGRFLLFV